MQISAVNRYDNQSSPVFGMRLKLDSKLEKAKLNNELDNNTLFSIRKLKKAFEAIGSNNLDVYVKLEKGNTEPAALDASLLSHMKKSSKKIVEPFSLIFTTPTQVGRDIRFENKHILNAESYYPGSNNLNFHLKTDDYNMYASYVKDFFKLTDEE